MNDPAPGDTMPSSVVMDATVAAMAASTAFPPASATCFPAAADASEAAAMSVRGIGIL
jgi:hypothetical protein